MSTGYATSELCSLRFRRSSSSAACCRTSSKGAWPAAMRRGPWRLFRPQPHSSWVSELALRDHGDCRRLILRNCQARPPQHRRVRHHARGGRHLVAPISSPFEHLRGFCALRSREKKWGQSPQNSSNLASFESPVCARVSDPRGGQRATNGQSRPELMQLRDLSICNTSTVVLPRGR